MPFSEEQFFAVFRQYNEAIWPMQGVLFLFGLVAVIAALFSKRVTSVIVAVLWAWCGVEYHWLHFAAVNTAAWIFGALFIFAGAAILLKSKELFLSANVPEVRRTLGFFFVAYALIGYPAVSYFAGHAYPAVPTFGTPCPLTIFTIGLVLMSTRPLPLMALALPMLWSLIGSAAIFRFGMLEDLPMPIAAAALAAYLIGERQAHVRQAPA